MTRSDVVCDRCKVRQYGDRRRRCLRCDRMLCSLCRRRVARWVWTCAYWHTERGKIVCDP